MAVTETPTVWCDHDGGCDCHYCTFCGDYVASCWHDTPEGWRHGAAVLRSWENEISYRRGYDGATASGIVGADWAVREARQRAREEHQAGHHESAAWWYGRARALRA